MPPRNAGPPSGNPSSRVYTCYVLILPRKYDVSNYIHNLNFKVTEFRKIEMK